MPRHKHRSRNLLESADGWATVPGRNRPPVRLAMSALEDRLEQLSLSPPPSPPRPHATAELSALLARDLDSACSILRAHPVLAPVRHALRLLHRLLHKPRGVQQRLVVLVLGLGSLEGATSSSSLLQLAMVLEIVDALATGPAAGGGGSGGGSGGGGDGADGGDDGGGGGGGGDGAAGGGGSGGVSSEADGREVEVVFRDPAFTSTDKAFLRKRWTVQDVGVDDGEDAVAVPTDTVLIAPHLDFDVLAQHLHDTRARRRPVLLVANDLEQFMDLSVPIHMAVAGRLC